MARDFILFITDELRPYLSVIDRGLEALEHQLDAPFFQLPAIDLGTKPSFARLTLSLKEEALLYKIKQPDQTEEEVLHAALVLAKKERERSKSYYQNPL